MLSSGVSMIADLAPAAPRVKDTNGRQGSVFLKFYLGQENKEDNENKENTKSGL